MARVFVTGSADGLGLRSAQRLVESGHEVVVHGRSPERAQEALEASGATATTHGDLASLAQTRDLAEQANAAGPYDAVIHNAGVYLQSERTVTEDGLAQVFQINTLAPYVLTALIERPRRLIYLTSGMQRGSDPALDDLQFERRGWSASQAYSESKLYDAMLAFAVARRWRDVASNAVSPGWVSTKMGGPSAPEGLEVGTDTQVWLAVADETAEMTGRYLYHREPAEAHPAAGNRRLQDRLLAACAELSGVALP